MLPVIRRRPGRGALLDTEQKTRIAFIDIGRAVAALLVFYSHLSEQWVAKRETGPTPVVDAIDAMSSDPMHMGAQGIGQIGVPFFFLVSGFVVTPIALRMGQRRFTANRLVRVYVPMFVVVLLTAGALLLGVEPLTGQRPEVSWWTVLTNMLVVNYVLVPQVALVGVAWTLIVELIFYAVLVLLLPVLRRWVWLGIAAQLTFVFVVLMSARQFGPSWFLFAVNVSYLPIPLLGQVVWATTAKKIPLWQGWVFAGLAWALYVYSDNPAMGRLDASYSLALACAVMFFLMGVFAEPKLRQRRFWVALSERSYSIYLLHGLVAFAVLDLLRPAVPLAVAVPVAVAATFGAVELSYRFVEKPSHALARRLSRAPRRPEPEEVVREAERGLAELRRPPEPAPSPSRRVVALDEIPAERTEEIPVERTEEMRRIRHPRPAPVSPPASVPPDAEQAIAEQAIAEQAGPGAADDAGPRRRRRYAGAGAVTVQSLLADRDKRR
ncbi:acyltransferase [Actinosynnema sp. NPDC050436]|uniref:acyltransferase family protein n=1 Tax=Actinosynnema sp. NPDC050436 TaxID=3155659 RepID=UPI0033F7B947